jgi:hypothetical protein
MPDILHTITSDRDRDLPHTAPTHSTQIWKAQAGPEYAGSIHLHAPLASARAQLLATVQRYQVDGLMYTATYKYANLFDRRSRALQTDIGDQIQITGHLPLVSPSVGASD